MVAASCYAYEDTIEHGKTGFLVRTKNDWKEYFNLLSEDVSLRNEISFNAWTFIKDNYTYKYAGDKTLQIYTDLFDFLYEGKTDKIWRNYDVKYFGKKDYEYGK